MSNSKWDELGEVVGQMRGGLERALAEAQRRFADSAEVSLPEMVVASIAQAAAQRVWVDGVWVDGVWVDGVWVDGVWVDGVLDGLAPCNLVLPSMPPSALDAHWLTSCGSECLGVDVGALGRRGDGLMIGVDSTSVDLSAFPFSRPPSDVAWSAEPHVTDVLLAEEPESGPNSQASRQVPMRWSVCLDVLGVDYPEEYAAVTTSFDFSDYDDEAIWGFLKN